MADMKVSLDASRFCNSSTKPTQHHHLLPHLPMTTLYELVSILSALLFACFLPAAALSRMLSRSLSNFNFVIWTLLGAIPIGTLWPLLFSRETRSTWITYLRRYTDVTLPSRPLFEPRVMRTSSSLRIGMERTCGYRVSFLQRPQNCCTLSIISQIEIRDFGLFILWRSRTLCFSRSSLLSGALIKTRLTLEGAV